MNPQQKKLLAKIKETGPITTHDKDIQKFFMSEIYKGDPHSVTKKVSQKLGAFLSAMKISGFLGVRKSTTIKNVQKQFVNEYFII